MRCDECTTSLQVTSVLSLEFRDAFRRKQKYKQKKKVKLSSGHVHCKHWTPLHSHPTAVGVLTAWVECLPSKRGPTVIASAQRWTRSLDRPEISRSHLTHRRKIPHQHSRIVSLMMLFCFPNTHTHTHPPPQTNTFCPGVHREGPQGNSDHEYDQAGVELITNTTILESSPPTGAMGLVQGPLHKAALHMTDDQADTCTHARTRTQEC